MTRAEWEALVEYTLNIGRQMMECGAEAWRAENTMARIFRAYGLEVLDAHVIATQAAVTVKTPTGEHYTSTCMILPDKTGTVWGVWRPSMPPRGISVMRRRPWRSFPFA